MKFEQNYDFDHDAATLMRLFGDKDYFMEKYRRMGGKTPQLVDYAREKGRFWITVRHTLETAKMNFPDMIKKRIGERVMLRQTDTWRLDERRGNIDIDIEKLPVGMTIGLNLVAREGDKSRLKLAFDIEANVPLLGGRIEKALAGPITKRMRNDLALTDRIAAENRV